MGRIDITLTNAQVARRSAEDRKGLAPVAVIVPPKNPGTRKRKAKRANPSRPRKRKGSWTGNYEAYLRSDEWTAKRRVILERDGYRCPCGSRRHLHVHHLTYERLGHELLDDLVTLCRGCHRRLHAGVRPARTQSSSTY